MRALLLLPLLVTFVLSASGQDGAVAGDGSPVAVLGSKWSKSRQTVEYPNAGSVAPAPAMTAANRIAQPKSATSGRGNAGKASVVIA